MSWPAFLPPAPLRLHSPASAVKTYRPPLASRRRPLVATATNASPAATVTQTPAAEVDVLVVGTGISASSLAFRLHKDHPSTSMLVTEARDVVGGNVISCQKDGYTWEEGPNTFQPAAHIMRLAVDVGLKEDLVLADSSLPRFVYWDKKLFALPMSPSDIPTFRLLSPLGAIRAGLGAMGFVLPQPGHEETIREFITRHLGKEVFDKMIDPFVSGVYAGDPSRLSMKSAFKKIFALQELGGTLGIVEGAIIRIGQKKRETPPLDEDLPTWKGGALGSFKNGLGMLPEAIAKILGDRVRLGWRMIDLEKREDGRFCAHFETSEGVKSVVSKAIAVTAPARVSAGILKGVAPGIECLLDIVYPTVWSITLAYPKGEFKEPLRGFGNLIPRSMGVRTLGTIWSSCLFPGRAPDGMELLLSYIGGAKDDAIKQLSEEEVVKIVDADIKGILMKEGCSVKPVVVGKRRWERAIPQYNVGYSEIMDKAKESLEDAEGVFLGGNYTSGVAFGDCVQWGFDYAPKIADFVKEKGGVEVESLV